VVLGRQDTPFVADELWSNFLVDTPRALGHSLAMNPREKGGEELPVPQVDVVVDDRERHVGVLAALLQMPGIDVRVDRLKSGDYIVEDRCVFERKTLLDFAASIVDGRLFRQSWRLVTSSPFSALILEGRSKELQNCQIRREALQGAMVSLSLVYRLPVLRSFGPLETAHLLLYAGRQMQKQDMVWGSHSGRRPRSRRRRQLHLLQALPGLGPERALRLLETFGTVQAVMTADIEALQAVTGIGAKTASAIRDVLQEEAWPYGNISKGMSLEYRSGGSCNRSSSAGFLAAPGRSASGIQINFPPWNAV